MPNRDNFVPMPVWPPNPKKPSWFDARYRGPGFILLLRLFCWLRESGGNCRYCNGTLHLLSHILHPNNIVGNVHDEPRSCGRIFRRSAAHQSNSNPRPAGRGYTLSPLTRLIKREFFEITSLLRLLRTTLDYRSKRTSTTQAGRGSMACNIPTIDRLEGSEAFS